MAHAYVKFTCDSKRLHVPVSFIKNFNQSNFVGGEKYPVFWSPVAGQTPQDVERAQGKVVDVDKLPELNSRQKQVLAGYYEAEILSVADSKAKLEEAITKKRVIVPSLKKKECLDRDKGKKGKNKKDYVSKEKQKKMIKKGEESTVSQWKEKYASKKEDPDSSDTNSDDELVPKSDLKKKEQENMMLRRDCNKLQLRNDTLLAQNEKLLELNFQWQNKHLNAHCTYAEPPVKKALFTENNSAKKVFSEDSAPTVEHDDSFMADKQNLQSSSPLNASQEELAISEEAVSEAERNVLNHSKENLSNSPLKISQEKNILTPKKKQIRPPLTLSLTPNKMKKILRGVKPRLPGDSQFVKNMAHTIFGVTLLLESSVSGKPSNKSDKVYPALPDEGMLLIEELLAKRLDAERPPIASTEREMRLSLIGKYVGQKINDLRKAVKKKLEKDGRPANSSAAKSPKNSGADSPNKSEAGSPENSGASFSDRNSRTDVSIE